MHLKSFINTRVSLARSSQWSWHLLGDSLRLGSQGYQATAKNTRLSLGLVSGSGEWFTFYENLIREDYLQKPVALKDGDHVIDIGANIGAFTVLAARKVAPRGHVYAFEPDPQICNRLKENVHLNKLTNVTILERAVGAHNGTAVFYQHPKNAYSSLHDGVDGRVQAHKRSFHVKVSGIAEALAKVKPGLEIALLKVDCEGSEFEIFNAMDVASAARVRQISMEVHPTPGHTRDGLIVRLKTLGFSVKDSYPLTAIRPAEPASTTSTGFHDPTNIKDGVILVSRHVGSI